MTTAKYKNLDRDIVPAQVPMPQLEQGTAHCGRGSVSGTGQKIDSHA